jgi:hypothetical protein
MIAAIVSLFFLVIIAAVVALLAIGDAQQAQCRCDELHRTISLATLDYSSRTAAARRKGWETRRRKAAALEERQMEIDLRTILVAEGVAEGDGNGSNDTGNAEGAGDAD